MGLLDSPKKRDAKIAAAFLTRFTRIIVGRDKKTGFLVVLFRSKSDETVSVKTDHKNLEVLEQRKNRVKS